MHHPTDRIAHTTVFVTPVVEHWPEREIVNLKYNDVTITWQAYNASVKQTSIAFPS